MKRRSGEKYLCLLAIRPGMARLDLAEW